MSCTTGIQQHLVLVAAEFMKSLMGLTVRAVGPACMHHGPLLITPWWTDKIVNTCLFNGHASTCSPKGGADPLSYSMQLHMGVRTVCIGSLFKGSWTWSHSQGGSFPLLPCLPGPSRFFRSSDWILKNQHHPSSVRNGAEGRGMVGK